MLAIGSLTADALCKVDRVFDAAGIITSSVFTNALAAVKAAAVQEEAEVLLGRRCNDGMIDVTPNCSGFNGAKQCRRRVLRQLTLRRM